MVAYDKFLRVHGPSGGWDERDHAKFKKILDRSGRDYSRVVEAAVVDFAGIYDRREVIQHARWDAEHEARHAPALPAWLLAAVDSAEACPRCPRRLSSDS